MYGGGESEQFKAGNKTCKFSGNCDFSPMNVSDSLENLLIENV